MTTSKPHADASSRPPHSPSPSHERAAALERGHTAPPPAEGGTPDALTQLAFVALAENVRDYAVFLLDASGIICYWGEGARLMKWWSRREAEGSHLRLLYPEKGAEDGTAEEHLRIAVERGEYVGEGCRVRRNGSTFWAGVALTAIKNQSGKVIGFVNATRDLTVRRSAEAALALAWSAQAAGESAKVDAAFARRERDAALEDSAFALEQVRGARLYARYLIDRELAAFTVERAAMLQEMALLNKEIERLGARSRGG